MRIPPEQVRQIANLANLRLGEEDTVRYARDLEKILDYVEQLDELDTSGVEPMAQVLHETDATPLRTDVPGQSFDQPTALRCAPLAGAGHFKVPKVIDR